MGFLTDEDFDDMPENDEDAFLTLEQLSRARMYEGPRDQDGDVTYSWANAYMNEIAALASNFKMTGIVFNPDPANGYIAELNRFLLSVDHQIIRIRIKRGRRNKSHSVRLSDPSRAKIRHHIERIRTEVTNSLLPEKRREAIIRRLQELEAELDGKRANLAVFMAAIALVATTAHDFQEMFNEAPESIRIISEIVGEAKSEEEPQQLGGPEPMRAIPDYTQKPNDISNDVFNVDKEIPF